MNNELEFYHITDTHHYAMKALGMSDHEDQKCLNEIKFVLISGDSEMLTKVLHKCIKKQ